ncbi:MAG: hydroxymethylglutaryl-CoA reductase, degradative [Bdellovibrionales bacterium RBG_16_40_8]|nr:MAG: hydroxymethylglutaryl-CoA reductase, degradative [Bdellovibrionales bacterium RBG_16_40_8]
MEVATSNNLDSSKELFSGFSKLDRTNRLRRLQQMGALTREEAEFLLEGAQLNPELAEHFIENVIGYFQIPLGVTANFIIDGRSVVVPMAVEETSIIAAASKTAKWINEYGEIITEIIGQNIIGQIQIAKVKDLVVLEKYLHENKKVLIGMANTDVAHGLKSRGGGVNDIQLRFIERADGSGMAVLHVFVNVVDAMGANIVNQICQYLKNPIEAATGETVTMCILSNLVDSKLTRAKIVLRGLDSELIDKIAEASYFAQLDPYRAATNNKGVLNGIDPILISTGNDWRAVEAGIHAYAARNGRYESITQWKVKNNELVGLFEAPIIVGVVGGMTRLHPQAKISLKMMNVTTAERLSRICAAVGLTQNLGALRALTTVGIIEGHMKLHIRNLTLGAGATENERPYVQKRLEEILELTKRITASQANEVLKEFRRRRAMTSNEGEIQL